VFIRYDNRGKCSIRMHEHNQARSSKAQNFASQYTTCICRDSGCLQNTTQYSTEPRVLVEIVVMCPLGHGISTGVTGNQYLPEQRQ